MNIDQRRSRRDADRVPDLLATLAGIGVRLGFERTAGDEVQALADEPAVAAAVLAAVGRLEATQPGPGWRIGFGIGTVEDPDVTSTREARGSAYLAAREALEVAERHPGRVALRGGTEIDLTAISYAETGLQLLRGLYGRRSAKGWEVTDLLGELENQSEVAVRLHVSESAISQRLDRAEYLLGLSAAELATHLVADAMRGRESATAGE